jgi:hypothetical protein
MLASRRDFRVEGEHNLENLCRGGDFLPNYGALEGNRVTLSRIFRCYTRTRVDPPGPTAFLAPKNRCFDRRRSASSTENPE